MCPTADYDDPILNIVQPDGAVEEAGQQSDSDGDSHYQAGYVPFTGGAAQPPVLGKPQFDQMNVMERAGILSKGFGAPANLPDPRTAPLKSLADPKAHGKEEAEGVKYLHDIRTIRSKYEITIGSTMKRRNEIFDTGRIKGLYFHKLGKNVGQEKLTAGEKAAPVTDKKRADVGIAVLGQDSTDHTWDQLSVEWAKESLIWVCSNETGRSKPCFYSHVGKIGRFHHSSFKAGGDVLGAGEWIVDNGKLLKISANSGHYRPPLDHLHRCVLYLAEAWNQNTVVLLWNVAKSVWEEVPVLMFRDNPSRNGTYKSHPSS